MKVGLVTCIKNENIYLKEFIEYYVNIGVDTIHLIDNNSDDLENVCNYLNINDFNKYYNNICVWEQFRNYYATNGQTVMYTSIYNEIKNDYDVILFFDIDEYLWLKEDKNIKDYLNRPIFKDYNTIFINWLMYDDNDLIYYEDRPLNERFTRARYNMMITQNIFTDYIGNECYKIFYNNNRSANYISKSIIFTDNKNINFLDCHRIVYNNSKVCDNAGNLLYNIENNIPEMYFDHFDESLAVLKHFRYKTIDEFVRFKLNFHRFSIGYDIYEFFNNGNYLTHEKIDYLKQHNLI